MITKAFILGAGLGTRLRPLTNVLPKPLVPLFHRPLIEHAFDRMIALGLTDLAINTHHLSAAWDKAYPSTRTGQYRGLNAAPSRQAQYKTAQLEFFHEQALLETGGGIKNAEEWTEGHDFLVYNADIYGSIALEPLLKKHASGAFAATLLLRREGPARHLNIEGDRVTDIRGQLRGAEGTHQFTGIYCLSAPCLARLRPNEKESIIPLFLQLAREGQLGAVVVDDGEWFDLGTRESYFAAHRCADLRPTGVTEIAVGASILPGGEVSDSWVSAGARVEAGAIVRNSILWPSAIVRAGAQIEDCVIFSEVAAGLKRSGGDY